VRLTQDLSLYLPLVHQVVRRFLGRVPANVLRDDLVAAGLAGLLDALLKNAADGEGMRGPAFEWYARVRIRGAILDELRDQDWIARRTRQRLRAQDEQPTMLGLDELPGSEPLVTDDRDAPDQTLERRDLERAVALLPERERRIVSLHYFQGVQLKAIAVELGVSEPRISQLHSRAIARLRESLADAA
jgi:RNA polymerase sigma factor for flagellar operon FliA